MTYKSLNYEVSHNQMGKLGLPVWRNIIFQ